MKKIIFTDEQVNNIIDLYINQNYTLRAIGNIYLVSPGVIKRVLQENDIELRKVTHKYACNYNIFNVIDSQEKAYWLGFLAADGCVYKREHNATVSINIHQKDREHLEKFKRFLNATQKIEDTVTSAGFSNNTPMSRISINSVDMAADLIDKGIVPRKSLILQPPKIEKEYYLSFIAGYFDGDGTIYKTSQNLYSIGFVGTKEILTWIAEQLNWENPTLEQRRETDKNTYHIRCGGIQKPFNIINQFYEQSPVHLDRKYDIYTEFKTVVFLRN